MENPKQIALIVIICLIIGTSIGYWLTPVKIEEKIVTKTIIARQKDTNVKRDTTITRNPDGTVRTEIRDRTEVSDSTKTDRSEESSKITTRDQKDWITSFRVSIPDRQTYTVDLSRRILGDIYFGVYGRSDREFGIGLTLRF